jgi:peptidoglycan/LPS O-acetylase OafA/YrhL
MPEYDKNRGKNSVTLRQDIQALRGVAVLLVVIYHARLHVFAAGYLGVDIFFVISGFLITSMIKSQIEREKFSFTEFYFRRAKRLLPAAYVTFTVTAILSVFLLTATEFRQFSNQLAGAVTFTANFVLMLQGSYFGGDAELKPLLHTWSLSIEEQYYLVMPALLFFVPRRFWVKIVSALVVISLGLCIGISLFWRPSFAFYLFPTRAWEMGLGSLGAFLIMKPAIQSLANRLFWPALAALLILPLWPIGGLHPGADAILACFATLIIILRGHPFMQSAVTKPLAFVGDFSYSLYLVHWPLFALLSNMWIGDLPLWLQLTGVFVSLVLAYAQYKYVEDPIRKWNISFSWKRAGMAALVSASVIALPMIAIQLGAAPEKYQFARRGNTGLGQKCVSDKAFDPKSACSSSATPDTLVWGDSYAMHLIPGIDATRGNHSIIQATKYLCGPLVGLAPVGDITGSTQNLPWARDCLDFNASVLEFARKTPSIKTVVLSSVFKQYMTTDELHILQRTPSGEVQKSGGVAIAIEGISATVNALRNMGKRVIVIAPPPALDWDAGLCAERKQRGLPTFGPFTSCQIPDADYQEKRKLVLRFLAEIPKTPGVNVIRFDEFLRENAAYSTMQGNAINYIANGHLSYKGSVMLAKKMHIWDMIAAQAK